MPTTFNGTLGPPDLASGASQGCYSPSLDISILVADTHAPAWSDDDGATWHDALSGGPFPGSSRCCTWIAALGLFVVSGDSAFIAYSSDGKNWSLTMDGLDPFQALGTPPDSVTAFTVGYGNGVFVIGGGGQGSTSVASATDPTDHTTFTKYSGTPFDTGAVFCLTWVAAWSAWFAGGQVSNVAVGATSPDLITWTPRTTPINGSSSWIQCCVWSSIDSLFVIGGASPNPGHCLASIGGSPAGAWTAHSVPFDDGGFVNALVEAGSLIYAAGVDGVSTISVVETTGDLDTWTTDVSVLDGGQATTIFPTSTEVIAAGFAGGDGGAAPAGQGAALINPWEHKIYVAGQLITPTAPNGHTYKAANDAASGAVVFIETTAAVAPFDLEPPVWRTDGSETPDGFQTWLDLGVGVTGIPTTWAALTTYGEADLVTPPAPDGHFYIPYPRFPGETGAWPNPDLQPDPWTAPYEGSDGTNSQGANFPAGGLDPTDQAFSSLDGAVYWQDLGLFASTPPAAPVLSPLTPGHTVIDLAWSTPADGGSPITGYNVYRGLSSGTETLLASLGVVNTFHDTGLTDGVTYFYKVSAVNTNGESALSNERSATPTPLAPPAPPTLLTAAAGNGNVTLTWAPNSPGDRPITGYNIYRGLVSGGEVLVATVGTFPRYVDFPLENGVTYFYEVTAFSVVGESGPSNELSATPAFSFRPRFFEGYQWRFLFANIPVPNAPIPSPGGVTTTWCEGLLTNRQIALVLNQASVITAAVWPDDPRVNFLFPPDSTPLVAPNNRIIYAFRREGGSPPWVCRAAGLLMSPEDQADADVPLTHLTAYDPWKYLEGRPCVNAAGQLPGPNGFSWFSSRGDQIITELLANTIAMDPAFGGGFCFVDAGVAFGGTPFYGGTIEHTDQINFQVQQGTMVADAWKQLTDTGNLDIVLDPIYDVRRPGYTHELSVYKLAGSDQPSAVFAWDTFSRSIANYDAMHDGTPGNFVNLVEYYVGQGGPPVPTQINNATLEQYLGYWSQQFFPDQALSTGAAVLAFAKQALTLGKQGRRTTTLSVTPERSPVPLTQYNLGDRVPIYASSRLRVARTGLQRVEGIPITVTDDGIEQVQALLCSPDWRIIL